MVYLLWRKSWLIDMIKSAVECKVVVPAGHGNVWNYNGKWYVGCQDCIDDKFKDNKFKDDKGD